MGEVEFSLEGKPKRGELTQSGKIERHALIRNTFLWTLNGVRKAHGFEHVNVVTAQRDMAPLANTKSLESGTFRLRTNFILTSIVLIATRLWNCI